MKNISFAILPNTQYYILNILNIAVQPPHIAFFYPTLFGNESKKISGWGKGRCGFS
jgi:hypothetical protein